LTDLRSLLASLSLLALLAVVPVANGQSFAVVGVLRLESNDNYVASSAIDTSSGYAYFGVSGKIIKIRLSDFLRISAYQLDDVEGDPNAAVIDSVSGFVYFGTYPSGGIYDKSGVIVKIRLSDFARVGTLVLNPGEDNSGGFIDTVHGFAYFISRGTFSSSHPSGMIVKVRLSDFTRVGELTLPGEGWPSSAVVDDRNGFAYIGKSVRSGGGGGIVVKISLADFAVVGTLNLNQDENELYSSVIDVTNGFAYFGGGLSDNYGDAIAVKIVKIRLSDLTRVSALTLNPDEGGVEPGVIDTANGFAYFATSRTIVRIRLSDFTRVDAIGKLDIPRWGNSIELSTAVIDPASGFAYFGTWTGPGYILKVSLPKSTDQSTQSTSITSILTTVPVTTTVTKTQALTTTLTLTSTAFTNVTNTQTVTTSAAQTTIRTTETATETSTSYTHVLSTSTLTELTTFTSSVTQTITIFANPVAEAAIALLVLAALATLLVPRIRARRFTSKVCPRCGYGNPPYAQSFCVKCGNPLEALKT